MGLNNANQPNKNRSEEFESKGSTLFVNVVQNNHAITLMSCLNAQLSQTELVRLFQYQVK